MNSPNIFTIKLKPKDGARGSDRTEYALENDIIFIGWGDLTFKLHTFENILFSYTELYGNIDIKSKECGTISRFYNDIMINDIVITRNDAGLKYACIILSDAFKREASGEFPSVHARRVKWLNNKENIEFSPYSHGATLRHSGRKFKTYHSTILPYAEIPIFTTEEITNIDPKCWIKYFESFKKKAELGRSGEKYVMKCEKEKVLNKFPNSKYPKHISLETDRIGYDILSLNDDEKEIYIEVKTTEISLDHFFYMTRNEIEKMKSNPEIYYIHRLLRVGEKFEQIILNINDIHFPEIKLGTKARQAEPEIYKVSLKRTM